MSVCEYAALEVEGTEYINIYHISNRRDEAKYESFPQSLVRSGL